jgi:glycosyltransferase involved in cell wall biosynthesis
LSLAEGFRDRGFKVDIVLLKAEGELLDLVPQGVNIVDLGSPKLSQAFLPLVRYLRRRRPAAAQAYMWPFTAFCILAARLAGTRIVTFDHAALSVQFRGRKKHLTALRFSARHLYPLAAERVFVANAAADDLAGFAQIPRDSLKVIYNPVRPIERPPVPPEIEAMWAGCDDRIVTAATLKPQKNHALLISAVAKMKRKARLMILGKGELLEELQEHARSLGVDVIFPGFAVDPLPYLASAKLFALSSDYEGFPVVLIEAMQLGLTIVSTDCPSGPREILDGGKFGRLAPCGDPDALARALDDALQNPSPPGLVQRRAEELSGPHAIDEHLELLLSRATYRG